MAVHVLVGGVGFVGARLAEHLSSEGETVIVVGRRRSAERRRRLARLLEGMRGVRLALAPGEVSARLLEEQGGDVYYHLAGKPGGPRRAQWEAHVGLLGRVVEAAGRLGARVVYVSSLAVSSDLHASRGLPPGSRALEEERHLEGAARWETYHSETKAEGERLAASYRGRWSIVRPGLVLGRYNYHPEARLLRALCRLRVFPASRWAPVVGAGGLAGLLARAGEGRYDGLWVHAVWGSLWDAAPRLCPGATRLDLGPLAALGRIAGRGSPLRLAWSILGRKYVWGSRHARAGLEP